MELVSNTLDSGLIVSRFSTKKRDIPANGEDLREAVRRHEFLQRIDEYLRKARESDLAMAVPGNAYTVHTGASAIALSAATAKTIMYVNAAAANQPNMTELCVSFDGVTASAVPALIELTYGTKASNSVPGTGSTSFTPLQLRGWPAQTSAQTAANNCSSEPTVQTTIKQFLMTPNAGLIIIQSPLGREPTGVASGTAISGNQFAARITAPAIVNTRGYLEYEE